VTRNKISATRRKLGGEKIASNGEAPGLCTGLR
jgi:hypothetical protein